MTLSQLIDVMVYQATALGSKNGDPDAKTVHQNRLRANKGVDGISEKRLYKNAVTITYEHQRDFQPKWPEKWFEQSIEAVAENLFSQEKPQ